jgi:hypothetical protein
MAILMLLLNMAAKPQIKKHVEESDVVEEPIDKSKNPSSKAKFA